MAEEIKQLQALLHEYDGSEEGAMEEGALEYESDTSADEEQQSLSPKHKQHQHLVADEHPDRTVKLKYGSLIKTIEASSRSTDAAYNSTATSVDSGESQTLCRNCLRFVFTVLYLIYSKAWVIVNTVFIFTLILILYSIKT